MANSASPHLRLSTPADRDAILAFIERMGFNPRDAVTWDALRMLAMTAWVGERLVGAIPLEPRELRISADRTMRTVHETVVAVDPAFRNAGLGSRLQQAIAEAPPADAKLVTVFREEPASPAYRWYLKNGFSPAMHITSWLCENPPSIAAAELPRAWNASDPFLPWPEVESLRLSHAPPGMLDRAARPLHNWLPVHPYRRRYDFHILLDGLASHAVLGVGTLHSKTVRVDVLELSSAPQQWLTSIAAVAAANRWTPIRLPLAGGDPFQTAAQSLGFTPGHSFDMLARPLSAQADPSTFPLHCWRYAGIDYI